MSLAYVPAQIIIITRLKAIIAEQAGIELGGLDSDMSSADFGVSTP